MTDIKEALYKKQLLAGVLFALAIPVVFFFVVLVTIIGTHFNLLNWME